METKTKVVIGVGVVVVVVAVGAVVYFKVIKPKKIAKDAQKAADEAARLAQSQGKTEQEVQKAAEAAAKNSAQNNNASSELTSEIVKTAPVIAVASTIPVMAKGAMEEEIKPSNIKIARGIHDAIDGITWSKEAQQKAANAIYPFSILPDNDFKQVYRYYLATYKENILGANGIAGELYVSADMLKKLTKKALAIKLNVK